MKKIQCKLLYSAAGFLAILLTAGQARAERRVALVIGNGDYKVPLETAVHDASEFAESLKGLQFAAADVINLKNRDQEEMRRDIAEFSPKAENADVVLFYFAGHGLQANGRNYLIPVKARISKVEDVPKEAIALDEIFGVFWSSSKARFKLLILDACRDNPFADPADTTDWVKGLAKPSAPPNGLVTFFATKYGDTAQDGRLKHSPFTASLLYYITEPGLTLQDLLIAVRDDVKEFTSGGQVPWADGIPSEPFYFRDPAWVEGEILGGDDEVLVLVNGEEMVSLNGSSSRKRKIPLKVGENRLIVKVYNQSTYRGGCSWFRDFYNQIKPWLELLPVEVDESSQQPEGWNFNVALRTKQDQLLLQGAESEPLAGGPRHGKMFTVFQATIFVYRETGEVSFCDPKSGVGDLMRWTIGAVGANNRNCLARLSGIGDG